LLLFNSVHVTVSTICRISFVCLTRCRPRMCSATGHPVAQRPAYPLTDLHENGILQGATRWVRMLQQRMVVLLPLLPGVSNALAARIVADQGLPAANSYRRPRHAVSPALRRRSIGCTIKKGVNR
jgi:hypothetical protein